jgi:hypothetical protein
MLKSARMSKQTTGRLSRVEVVFEPVDVPTEDFDGLHVFLRDPRAVS